MALKKNSLDRWSRFNCFLFLNGGPVVMDWPPCQTIG